MPNECVPSSGRCFPRQDCPGKQSPPGGCDRCGMNWRFPLSFCRDMLQSSVWPRTRARALASPPARAAETCKICGKILNLCEKCLPLRSSVWPRTRANPPASPLARAAIAHRAALDARSGRVPPSRRDNKDERAPPTRPAAAARCGIEHCATTIERTGAPSRHELCTTAPAACHAGAAPPLGFPLPLPPLPPPMMAATRAISSGESPCR